MISRLVIVMLMMIVAVEAATPTLSPYYNYYSTTNSTMTQAGAPEEYGTGITSWQMDEQYNRTAWVGTGENFVADFGNEIAYFIDYEGNCQYTCVLMENTPCDSQLDGNSLCSYDYLHRAVFVGEETIDGEQVNHFHFDDPLGPISMANHDVWISTSSSLPVQFAAEFTPFGTWEANVTSSYFNFVSGTPPAANFAVKNTQYCDPGTDDECQNLGRRIHGHMLSSRIVARQFLNPIVLEEN